jgi:Holliday junction resolvase-like predicted endonuclease
MKICFNYQSKTVLAVESYWDRKGESESEIDIIALNGTGKRLVFYEVKRNRNRINLAALQQKAVGIVKKYPDFQVEYKKLSLENM